MKKFITLLLVFLMIFSFAACGQKADEPQTKTTLVLGTSADYAPYEFMYPNEKGDMVYGGIDISVAEYIADYMGLDLEVINMDFGYVLTACNKGDFDMVLACIEPTEDRLKVADFSDPYINELPEMILIRKADEDKYVDCDTSFAGVNVGAQAGSTKPAKVNEHLVGANCVELPLVPDLVNELVNGKIDAIYLDGAVAVTYAETNPELAVAKASEKFADDTPTCHVAVAKGDPKGLLPQINAAIAKLTAENKIEDFKALADSLSGVAVEVSADAPEGYTPDSAN